VYADAGAENADLATAAAVVGGAHDTGGSRRSTQPGWIVSRRASTTPNGRITRSGAVKTTVLIDCETGVIRRYTLLDETTARYTDRVAAAESKPRQIECSDRRQRLRLGVTSPKLRSEGVKPVIKHREFGWHGVANNVLLDDTTYHQRSNIEATFSRFDANTADRARENLVRSVPRTRSQMCRQKHRTRARRL